MRLRYIGGLGEACLPGVFGSAKPGETIECDDEDRAAGAVDSGDWELADDVPAPRRQARVEPTPQKGK